MNAVTVAGRVLLCKRWSTSSRVLCHLWEIYDGSGEYNVQRPGASGCEAGTPKQLVHICWIKGFLQLALILRLPCVAATYISKYTKIL